MRYFSQPAPAGFSFLRKIFVEFALTQREGTKKFCDIAKKC
jgi:hypothetical protein